MKTLQDVKDYILEHYDPEDTLGVHYDTGNMSDTYEMGKEHGESVMLYYLGVKLGLSLDEPQWSED